MKREKQVVSQGLSDVQDQILRYLLDQLTEEERAQLEERMVRDPFFLERVAAVEDDLIIEYLRGELDSHRASRFNEVYMSSQSKRARVDAARALTLAVKDVARSRRISSEVSSRRGFGTVAAAAVILVAVLWSLWRYYAPAGVQTPEKISSASFLLQSGLSRSAGGVQISLPPGIKEVRLELIPPDATVRKGYQAILATPERPAAWKGPAFRKDTNVVTVIPVDVLVPGDYRLELMAEGRNVATYYFRMSK